MFSELGNFNLNIGDFADLQINFSNEFQTRYIKPPKSNEIAESHLKYSEAKKLAKELKINKGDRYFCVVNGTFYFGDFIEAFVVENNIRIKSMTISTLSLNENNVDSLANLINGGYIDKLDVIISDFFFSHERHNLIPYLYEQLDVDDKFQLAVAGTHCKMCIFETYGGKFIVIHGSANLRSSGNIEQFVIEENEELYRFNLEYQNLIIDKFKTINKAIRGNKLWQAVVAEAVDVVEKPVKANRQKQKTECPK